MVSFRLRAEATNVIAGMIRRTLILGAIAAAIVVSACQRSGLGLGAGEVEEGLAELMAATGLTPENDRMPIDEGIKKELPDQKIR